MRPVGLACVLIGVLLGPPLLIFLHTHQKILGSYIYNASQVISSLREHYCISFDFEIWSGGIGQLGMATRGV